jgi:hypothetical protein
MIDPVTAALVLAGTSAVFGIGNAIAGHRQRKRERKAALEAMISSNRDAAKKMLKIAERQANSALASSTVAPSEFSESSPVDEDSLPAFGIAATLNKWRSK